MSQKVNDEVLTKETDIADEIENNELEIDDKVYQIFVHNNDHTSFQAVIAVLYNVFGLNQVKSIEVMQLANDFGKAFCHFEGTRTACERKKLEADIFCAENASETIEGLPDRTHMSELLLFTVEEKK